MDREDFLGVLMVVIFFAVMGVVGALRMGMEIEQDKAVKAGAAEYTIDPITGKVWLVYK